MKSKQNSFLELYEPIHDRFERFCRARVYGDIEFRDLMNDSLLVAFEKFDQLKSKDAFLSFLIGISIRILGSKNQKIRETRLNSENEGKQLIDNHSNTESLVEIHFLYESLAKISDEQREAIILFEISGFSIKEIAELQQASESAVKQRLKRGREKLIERMNFESALKMGEMHHE